MIKAVIFDLDDTLLNSLSARCKAMELVCVGEDIRGIIREEFMLGLQGGPLKDALERLAKDKGIKQDLFNCYRRNYWFRLKGSNSLYPGVKNMLKALKKDGYALGIVTNKFRDFEFEGGRIGCMLEVKRTRIGKLFSAIIGFEDVQEQKPSPDGINMALELLNASSANTLVVGDSPADMAAAKAAGCLSCRALWGTSPEFPPAHDIGADYFAVAPGEILGIIARSGNVKI